MRFYYEKGKITKMLKNKNRSAICILTKTFFIANRAWNDAVKISSFAIAIKDQLRFVQLWATLSI